MKTAGKQQTQEWAKRYRLFLWVLLLTVLVLGGCIFYSLRHRPEIPKEGMLVRSEKVYERKA